MDAREELIAQMYDVIRGALIVNEQRSFMEQVQEAARGVLDALLADGRWLLVHPDEMIRPQVGHCDRCGTLCVLCSGHTINVVRMPMDDDEPLAPAVEKENNQ